MKTIYYWMLKALGKVKVVHIVVLVLLIFLIFNSYKHKSDYNRMFNNMQNELTKDMKTIVKNNKAVITVKPNYFTRTEAKELLSGEFEMLRKEFKMKAIDQITNISATSEAWTTGDLNMTAFDEIHKLLKEYFNPTDTNITSWEYVDGFFTVIGGINNDKVIQLIAYDLYMNIYKGKKRRWDKEGIFNKINIFARRDPYLLFTSKDTTLKFNNIEFNEIN